jgi:RNA-directed DNA polymerase
MGWLCRSTHLFEFFTYDAPKGHVLGFMFRAGNARWSAQALENFKYRIRRLTKRSWGISMQRRLRERRLYLQGWINYFCLS